MIDSLNSSIISQLFSNDTGVNNFNLDISCSIYNQIITNRISEINNILETNPNSIRPWTRSDSIYGSISRNDKLTAGNRFTTNFPSKCQECISNNFSLCASKKDDIGLNQKLLTKKAYMFVNSNNKNVISGPITYRSKDGIVSSLQFGGTSGAGLTQSHKIANLARGKTPQGRPGRQFGVQKYIGIELFSNSNIFSNTIKTQNINGKYVIPFCRR